MTSPCRAWAFSQLDKAHAQQQRPSRANKINPYFFFKKRIKPPGRHVSWSWILKIKIACQRKKEEERKGTEKGEKEEVAGERKRRWGWGNRRGVRSRKGRGRWKHRYNYRISRQAVVWPASQSQDETDAGACPWFVPPLTDALMCGNVLIRRTPKHNELLTRDMVSCGLSRVALRI